MAMVAGGLAAQEWGTEMSAPLSSKLAWELMNPIMASTLNPIIAAPQSSGRIVKGFNLVSGANVINHGLGRQLRGWSIVDINAAITYYRSAPFNDKTLTLTCSGAATANIEVF